MTGRERILTLLAGGAPDSLPLMPITMMFAADQIGAPYRSYASDYRVLGEGQVQTAAKFDFDYVSAISDPAREASDLGAAIEWFDHQPPALSETRALLADKKSLLGLKPSIGPRMSDRLEAVRLLGERAGRDKIVEGWVEGPCALSADLRGINALMLDFFDDPPFARDLLVFCVAMELDFARAQVEAGADLIGVGDAASSLLGPRLFQEFVEPFECRLVAGIQAFGARVRLHICGRTRKIYRGMAKTGADIVDLDSLAPMDQARAEMGPEQALLGNIDPVRVLLHGDPETVRAGLAECHRQAGARYIAGAGCEVPRGTPEANLLAMTRYAHARH